MGQTLMPLDTNLETMTDVPSFETMADVYDGSQVLPGAFVLPAALQATNCSAL